MKILNLRVITVLLLLITGFMGICDSIKPTLAFDASGVKIKHVFSSWGKVFLESTSINIEVVTNEPELSKVPLKVDCNIYLNEVNVVSGLGEDLCIIPYESGSSVHFSVTIDNEKIIDWWVSHVNNGEQTEVRIEGKVILSLDEVDIFYPYQFLKWLRNHLQQNRYDVLFPVGDIPQLIVSKNKEELSELCRIPVADFETIMKARDKKRTIKIARQHHVPCPKTYFVDDIDQVEELSKTIDFPVIIKLRQGAGGEGISLVGNREELLSRYPAVHKYHEFPLIQDFIPPGAPKYSFSGMFSETHEPVATFTQVAWWLYYIFFRDSRQGYFRHRRVKHEITKSNQVARSSRSGISHRSPG